jgi:hypothetical protein
LWGGIISLDVKIGTTSTQNDPCPVLRVESSADWSFGNGGLGGPGGFAKGNLQVDRGAKLIKDCKWLKGVWMAARSLKDTVDRLQYAIFFLENFGTLATIYDGGCEMFAERLFRNFGASSAGRMVVDSLMTLEMDAGADVDPVEEMRLRTWARKNYAPAEERDENWHPIVLDEMDRKDRETSLLTVFT